MIKITRKDVEKAGLENFTAKEFRDWLRIGSEEYFIEKNRRENWNGLFWFIGSRGDPIIELGEVYRACSPQACLNWRKGLADLLKELPTQQRYTVIFEFLLNLAGQIQAYDILEYIPTTVGNGYFGFNDNAIVTGTKNLFETTLDIVAGMAGCGNKEQVEEIIIRLIASSNFSEELSGLAFIALCRANPLGLIDHIKRIRGPMFTLCNQNPNLDLSELGWQVCDNIEVPLLAKLLSKVNVNINLDLEQDFDDRWFLSALFKGDNAPLAVRIEPYIDESNSSESVDVEEKIYIRRSENPLQMKESLTINLKNEIINELKKYVPPIEKEWDETINTIKEESSKKPNALEPTAVEFLSDLIQQARKLAPEPT